MKTLAMIKMEKNFVAHMEKKYPRKPYDVYTCRQLLNRIQEEFVELVHAVMVLEDKELAKKECADISNLIDYVFERLMGDNIE